MGRIQWKWVLLAVLSVMLVDAVITTPNERRCDELIDRMETIEDREHSLKRLWAEGDAELECDSGVGPKCKEKVRRILHGMQAQAELNKQIASSCRYEVRSRFGVTEEDLQIRQKQFADRIQKYSTMAELE